MAPDSTTRTQRDFLKPWRQWDGALPIIMSIIVLVMILLERLQHGAHAPHHDEGTADHIAIVLMYGQIPIVLWFVAMRRHPVAAILPTLAIQLGLWAITFAAAALLT